MLISLITQNEYCSMRLPERREGRFLLRDPRDGQPLFQLTGGARGWTVTETFSGFLPNRKPMEMLDKMLIHVRIRENMEQALLFIEDVSQFYAKFARCLVADNVDYRIGSGEDCDFVCGNIQISRYHCRLTCRNRVWTVTDLNSSSGTFVNGMRVTSPRILLPGDVVSVLNQKFIVLPGLLAFNAQNIDSRKLEGKFRLLSVPTLPLDKPLAPEFPRRYFRRRPRYLQSVKEEDLLNIQAPPDPRTAADTNPALLTMGPTIISGLAMLAGGMTNPVTGIGMLASSLIFPQISRKRREKLLKEEEEKRKEIYSRYLEKLDREMDDLVSRQAEELRQRNPDPRIEAERILQDVHEMWSRRPEQADFLDVRLGTGTLPTMARLNFPPQDPLDDDEDPMQQKLLEFQKKSWDLRDVPIILPMEKFDSIGITGPDKLRTGFAASILAQLAMHIGCDDMQLFLIGHLNEDLDPLRWLPHTWSVQNSVHFSAENKEELLRLVSDLDQVLSLHRKEENDTDDRKVKQELVILITQEELAHTGVLTRLLFDQDYSHVHVIILSEHSGDLPSRTSLTIGLRPGKGKMVWQDGGNRAAMTFVPDEPFGKLVQQLSDVMANTYLDIRTDSLSMPSNVPFLDLFGVSDVRHLNILSRWENADPVRRLSAPLGISEDGDLCTLDLHEKADGPHGLIAGTTGSGKSELIMAYILSMAINYSPDDVAFVLIDYKGGGMAQAFEHLPHTAGIMTNLDGNELNRSLMSINSELQRRQRIFAETKRTHGNIQVDIYKYQQLYHSGKVSEPLPHLVIITDEFAELKMQQPDFMQELIRAARIGRSLGVHLILATQKPSGVVNDQIWSNTNFRLCLRVQDAGDSREVIKAPDAAGLTNPGSFFKQVGYGISMTKAQSGYTGADYLPEETAIPKCGIDILDNLGIAIRHEAVPRVQKSGTSAQLKVVTEYITELALRENIHTRRLWEPPLEAVIPLGSLYKKYTVNVDPWLPEPVIGEADDPANQRRLLIRMPLFAGKNAILFGAIGSGKLMTVSTIIEDLLLRHNADQINLYILDHADDGLHIYAKAPQVGDVLFSDDDEKLSRLLSFLEDTVRERRKILGGAAASIPLKERLEKAGLPNILIILHQFSSILSHMEKYMDSFLNLMKDGPRWGITFLATQENINGIRYQVLQRFALSYVLQMDHPEDYSSVLGRTGKLKPGAFRGRGLLRIEDGIYEYQTAAGSDEPENLCFMLQNEWHGKKAPAIRVMPEKLCFPEMLDCLKKTAPLQLPVGLDCETIEPVIYPFDSGKVQVLMGSDPDVERFLDELLPLAGENGLEMTVLGNLHLANDLYGIRMEEDLPAAVNAMFMECRRMKEENSPEQIAGRKKKLFIIPSAYQVLNSLSEDDAKYLRAMLEIAKPEWKWTFLVCENPLNFDILKRSKFDRTWITNSVDPEAGIYLGSGINSQNFFRVSGNINMLRQNISFPLGYVIRSGEAKRVRFMDGRGGL